MPRSVVNIGETAFMNTGLTNITIPDSLTSIGRYAFQNCSNLERIVFPNTTGWYRTMSSSDTSGTNMTMTNSTQNATWLTKTYYNYYFKRNA